MLLQSWREFDLNSAGGSGRYLTTFEEALNRRIARRDAGDSNRRRRGRSGNVE